MLRLQRLYPGSVVKDAVGSVLVPRPTSPTDAGQPLKDTDLLRWATELINQILSSVLMRTFRITAVETLPEVFSHFAHPDGPGCSASCRRITSGSRFLGARGASRKLG